eukprot:84291-Rhodomonas_salina.2
MPCKLGAFAREPVTIARGLTVPCSLNATPHPPRCALKMPAERRATGGLSGEGDGRAGDGGGGRLTHHDDR